MLAPAATPVPIVNSLNDAILKSLARSETKERLKGLGAIAVGDPPAQFTEFLKADAERWARVIKAAGVKAEQ